MIDVRLQAKRRKWQDAALPFNLSQQAMTNLELLEEISLVETNALVRLPKCFSGRAFADICSNLFLDPYLYKYIDIHICAFIFLYCIPFPSVTVAKLTAEPKSDPDAFVRKSAASALARLTGPKSW